MIPAIGLAICGWKRHTPSPPHVEDPAVNAVEIDLENLDDPLPVARYVRPRDFDLISVHSLRLPVTEPEIASRQHLQTLKAIALENGAQSISHRLVFSPDRSGATPKETDGRRSRRQSIGQTCRNVEAVQRQLGNVHFFLETATGDERFPRELGRPESVSSVLSKTGCGWLLDVTRLYVESLNSGRSAYDWVEEVVPAASRVQMHLTGLAFDERTERFVESSSHPIPEPVLELYQFVLEVALDKTDAVFVRRDRRHVGDAESSTELRSVREIAEGVSGIGLRACALATSTL
jgi:uncharacterized protein